MALYNNGFPMTYPQMYYPQMPSAMPQQAPVQQPVQQPTVSGGVIWVQGEAGAKSYLMAPNSTAQLWDSERQTIYLKSTDASGMPSMKYLDYTIRGESEQVQTAGASQTDYATKADVKTLKEQIESLRSEIDGLTIRKAPARKKEADADE